MVRDIGNRLELFIDKYLIKKLSNLNLMLHSPTPKEIIFQFNKSWEGPYSAYVTIFKDEDGFKMYYRGHPGDAPEVTCMAQSRDGISWRRPDLRIFSFKGSFKNNIIWIGRESHNFTPFIDENPDSKNERYKAVGGIPLYGFTSKDGIYWKKVKESPLIYEGTFDSQNLAFWDKMKEIYVCYFRDYLNGIRFIKYSSSKDFINWSMPVWLKLKNSPKEHLYTNGIIPYFRAPHIYLAFPKRFLPDRAGKIEGMEDGLSEAVFMCSRDGLNWERRFLEAFIRPGEDRNNWNHRSNMPAWGIIPTSKKELSIYYSQYYFQKGCSLRRGVLRMDGFVSLRGDYKGGYFLSHLLKFKGKNLYLNYSTSASGHIKIEILDKNKKLLLKSKLIYGDEIEEKVIWEDGFNLERIENSPIYLKISLKDADLYSLQFR